VSLLLTFIACVRIEHTAVARAPSVIQNLMNIGSQFTYRLGHTLAQPRFEAPWGYWVCWFLTASSCSRVGCYSWIVHEGRSVC
jgi:hypothetical protein